MLEEGDLGVDYNFGEHRRSLPPVLGDANNDGVFDSADLVEAFLAGEYEDGIEDNSTFAEGDWNGDGDFDSADLVAALQTGLYVNSLAIDRALDEWR